MTLHILNGDFSVCKITDENQIKKDTEMIFTAKTDEEFSLVCKTTDVPETVIEREDGWKAFRVQGVLDFSLIGIISKISGILAENKIGIFVVSTFNTDYVFVKKENFDRAKAALEANGYIFD